MMVVLLITALTFSSCLESGLEELDTYTGKDITASYVYYRYINNDKQIPASGEPEVKQLQLNSKNTINAEKGTCDIIVTLPKNFPASQKDIISVNSLVVAVQLSTAAIITPIENAVKLGVPANWSTAQKYRIKAADGTEKDWTITVTLNK